MALQTAQDAIQPYRAVPPELSLRDLHTRPQRRRGSVTNTSKDSNWKAADPSQQHKARVSNSSEPVAARVTNSLAPNGDSIAPNSIAVDSATSMPCTSETDLHAAFTCNLPSKRLSRTSAQDNRNEDERPITFVSSSETQNDKAAPRVESSIIRQLMDWSKLSVEEKEKCCGTKCPTKRFGRNAWFIGGPLKSLSSEFIGKTIERIYSANHQKIHRGTEAGFTITPVLLGASEDIDLTEPVILLQTTNPKIGRRLKVCIEKSQQYQKFKLVFRIEVDLRSISYRTADSKGSGSDGVDSTLHDSICGRVLFAKQMPADGTQVWKRTTCGGVVVVQDQFYALTVAHCLFSSEERQSGSDSGSNSDPDNDYEDIGSDDDDDDATYSRSEPTYDSAELISNDFAFYFNDDTITEAEEETKIEHFDAGPPNPLFLGRRRESGSETAQNASVVTVSVDEDWALIPLQESRFKCANKFAVANSQGRCVVVDRVGSKMDKYPEILYLATGVSGILKVSIVDDTARHIFPWGRTSHRVLSIDCIINPGDSGAWLFDPSGVLYGVAVATVPSLSITYVLYAEDILMGIMSQLGWSADHYVMLSRFLPPGASSKSITQHEKRIDDSQTTEEPAEALDSARFLRDSVKNDEQLAQTPDALQKAITPGASTRSEELTALSTAIINDDLEKLSTLLETGVLLGASNEESSRPLCSAATGGQDIAVDMLIGAGVNVNAPGEFGNALQIASAYGHEKVVETLLMHGAVVNAQEGRLGNPLQIASARGHKKVVQMLVDAGADVNAQVQFGSPLHLASARGHEEVVQILVNSQASIGALGNVHGSALRAASADGHEKVVRILLDAGAAVNIQGGRFAEETALYAAAMNGHVQVARMLLDAGANMMVQGEQYGNALHIASERGDEDMVQILLKAGASVNAHKGVFSEETALFAASVAGHEKVVQVLLSAGAHFGTQKEKYDKVLRIAEQRGHVKVVRMLRDALNDTKLLQLASAQGQEETVQMLIDSGVDFNAGGEYGNALQAASDAGHRRVVRMLLDAGADVNANVKGYGAALVTASYHGHEAIVQLLLDAGADVNAEVEGYGTALIAISYHGHEAVAELLLNAGADVNAKVEGYGTALIAASYHGHGAIVQLLLNAGADVNEVEGYRTALIAASYHGYEAVVQLLLDAGADVNTKVDEYGTTLVTASCRGHVAVAELLLNAGADVNAEVERYGTALIAASCHGHGAIVQLLLDAGADVNAEVEGLGNALRAASFIGHEVVVQLLLDRGANINTDALLYELKDGNEKLTQILLDAYTNVDIGMDRFARAIEIAASKGHENVVRFLEHKRENYTDGDIKHDITPLTFTIDSQTELVRPSLDKRLRSQYIKQKAQKPVP